MDRAIEILDVVDFGSGHVFHRKLLELPIWNNLSERTRRKIAFVESALNSISPLDFHSSVRSFLAKLDGSLWQRLQHDLSWCFLDSPPMHEDWLFRIRVEYDAISQLEDSLWLAVTTRSFHLFCTSLQELCSFGLGTSAQYRFGDMSVGTTEARGGRVVFPHADLAQQRLVHVMQILSSPPYRSSLFLAIIVMTCVTNAHPFIDGNGRTSRMLFNMVLRRGGMAADCYIPLYEFIAQSRGGFQLRVRQAEIRGEWDPLCDYICEVLLAMASFRG